MNTLKKSVAVLASLMLSIIMVAYAAPEDKASQGDGASWTPRFRALVHYNDNVEPAHREFAQKAVAFLKDMTIGDAMVFDITTTLDDFTTENLSNYHLVVSLNEIPGRTPEQREAFERYMKSGGAWLGFHAACRNDLTKS